MKRAAIERVRIGLLGLSREHLDLLPALFRDPRVTICWVDGQTVGPTVTRLAGLFDCPAIDGITAGALAEVGVLLGPAGRRPDLPPGALNAHVHLTDADLASLQEGGGFNWEAALARASGGELAGAAQTNEPPAPTPAPGASLAPAGERPQPALPGQPAAADPEQLPAWFADLTDPERLGAWFCERIEAASGGSRACLLLLLRAGRCVAAFQAGGGSKMRPSGRAPQRLARALAAAPGAEASADGAIAVAGLPEEPLLYYGLQPGQVWLLRQPLAGNLEACLLLAADADGQSRAGSADDGLRFARSLFAAQRDALEALGRLARERREARNWRRARWVWRRLQVTQWTGGGPRRPVG
jgi:hypothetical protein